MKKTFKMVGIKENDFIDTLTENDFLVKQDKSIFKEGNYIVFNKRHFTIEKGEDEVVNQVIIKAPNYLRIFFYIFFPLIQIVKIFTNLEEKRIDLLLALVSIVCLLFIYSFYNKFLRKNTGWLLFLFIIFYTSLKSNRELPPEIIDIFDLICTFWVGFIMVLLIDFIYSILFSLTIKKLKRKIAEVLKDYVLKNQAQYD